MNTLTRAELYDKIYACWLGKNIGGTLGTPVEGRKDVMSLTWYPVLDPKGALPNDDLDLQLVNLHAMEQYGVRMTATELASEWTEHVYFPWDEYGYSGTAMRYGFKPPFSGTFDNSFTDCMGSPIRSEIWAAICAGNPKLAAYFAWQDAVVDHAGGEGVFGEIFNAALEAAAYTSGDVPALIREALTYIPADCRVALAVSEMLSLYEAGTPLLDAREIILQNHGRYNFTDAPQNIAFELTGLLWGESFEDAILKVANLGYDTDCTVATCGAILGILYGTAGIDPKWAEPIGDTIQVSSAIRGFRAPANLEELTRRCLALHDKLALENPDSYVITEEDNRDFEVQHFVLPQGCLPSEGFCVDLKYNSQPMLAVDYPADLTFRFKNNTAWPWHLSLDLRVPHGVTYASQQDGRFSVLPGETAAYSVTLRATQEIAVPLDRALRCALSISRFNDRSLWTVYDIPFTLLYPHKWRLNGECSMNVAATTVHCYGLPRTDGVYTAETTLASPVTRATRIICHSQSPLTVELDGEVIMHTDEPQPFLPAYHRVPAPNRWDGVLTEGEHAVKVTLRVPDGQTESPFFVFTANAPAEVSEPGNFYAYIDDICK